METKQDVVRKLEKKIDVNKGMIIDNISYIQEAMNEIECSMNLISYLSYLKDEFIKNDGV